VYSKCQWHWPTGSTGPKGPHAERERERGKEEKERPARKSVSGYWTSVLPRHFRIANSMGALCSALGQVLATTVYALVPFTNYKLKSITLTA